jgi:hypothetical protein
MDAQTSERAAVAERKKRACDGDDVNENCVVAMLHDNDFRELFMGDAGERPCYDALRADHPLAFDPSETWQTRHEKRSTSMTAWAKSLGSYALLERTRCYMPVVRSVGRPESAQQRQKLLFRLLQKADLEIRKWLK